MIKNIIFDLGNVIVQNPNIEEVDNSAIHTPLKGQKRSGIWHTCQITNGKKGRDLDLYLFLYVREKYGIVNI